MKREYTQAFRLHFDGLKIAETRKNEPEIGFAKMELGMVFIQFNEPQLAMKLFNEAEAIFRKLDQPVIVARCGYLRAYSYRRSGEFEISNQVLMKALDIYKSLNDSIGIAEVSNSIGLNYKNLKQPEKAVPYYTTSIEVFKKSENVIFCTILTQGCIS